MRPSAPLFLTLAVMALLLSNATYARDKPVYQTTKLLELQSGGTGFCFVVQIDDLAYVAVAGGHVPRNLIVGDPMQIKITGDHIWVKTNKRWQGLDRTDEIEARINIRERMARDTKLPTCSLSVEVH